LEQKYLLHAHSHFAFSGWVSHLLYSGLALTFAPFLERARLKKYNRLLAFNLVCSFGMLVAFTLQGYKAVSITFSTLSIIVAVLYLTAFIRDQRYLRACQARRWWLAGLLINVGSTLGPLSLAYMMATKNLDNNFY